MIKAIATEVRYTPEDSLAMPDGAGADSSLVGPGSSCPCGRCGPSRQVIEKLESAGSLSTKR
jgi:hypothetical protein